MKKIKNTVLISVIALLLTGCVKYNANMDIKKDKSMDFTIIYAVNSTLLENKELLDENEKEEVKKQGFTVEDYSEDNMKGVKLSKKINNIDAVSDEEEKQYSLSGILNSNTNKDKEAIFKVKKGLIKNHYTAKFEFNAGDSDLNSTTGAEEEATTTDETEEQENDDTKWEWETEENSSESNESETNSDLDLSSLTSNLDLSFNVTLPYSAVSSNATTKNDDNKSLSWNLSPTKKDAIEFEFELYNWTNIYIGIGVILIIIIVAILLILNLKKKKTTQKNNQVQPETPQQETVVQQTQPEMPQQETVVPQVQPETPQQETVVPQVQPEMPQQETVVPQVQPETPQPETVVPQVQPETPQQETVVPQVQPETPQQDNIFQSSNYETNQQIKPQEPIFPEQRNE